MIAMNTKHKSDWVFITQLSTYHGVWTLALLWRNVFREIRLCFYLNHVAWKYSKLMNGISYEVYCASYRDNTAGFLQYSFLMSFIVSLSLCFPPFTLLWLKFFNFELWTMTVGDPDHSPLLLSFLCFQDTIVFLFRFFFSRENISKGLCCFSFQLFFWLCPLTSVGSIGLALAMSQDAVSDINGLCTRSSSLRILLCSPLMLSLEFPVQSHCESQLSLAGCKSVWKQRDGEEGDKKI